MIFYVLLFILSCIGSIVIVIHHKDELVTQYEVFLAEHPANFAYFMTEVSSKFYMIWNTHLRNQLLLFIEKRLRWFRIVVLRAEHLLSRATHRVRDASHRNAASLENKVSDENITEQNKESK